MFQFTGNVGRDAEVKSVNGKTVLEYSVGVYAGKDKEGNSQTLWVTCSKWYAENQQVNQLDLVKKGDLVLIDARPNPVRIYTTNAGQQGASLEVMINRSEVLKRAGDGSTYQQPSSTAHLQPNGNVTKTSPVNTPMAMPSDDLPF